LNTGVPGDSLIWVNTVGFNAVQISMRADASLWHGCMQSREQASRRGA